MIKVSILAPPPRLIKAGSVGEWLEFLQLLYLEDYFDGYSLKKIASLWELELNAVREIMFIKLIFIIIINRYLVLSFHWAIERGYCMVSVS